MENQNIEYKESWRDEYLKWICGFANAQGGKLYIGISDNGEVCGVENAHKLSEDIPNKVRDVLGIIVNVNSHENAGKAYIEIVVDAVLLFHKNPEKMITGCYTKIAMFEDDADILYMDEVHGSLIHQADTIIDLLYLKYLKAYITYEDVTRVETYPFPKLAVREAIFNALIHSNWAASVPVQICVYEDKLYISNDCILHEGWTVETLMTKHRSMPFNPDIANTFFRAGYIEAWGRGIEKICKICKEYGSPEPVYQVMPQDIMLRFDAKMVMEKITTPITTLKTSDIIIEQIEKNPNITYSALAEICNLTKDGIKWQIRQLKLNGRISRVGSEKSGYWVIIKRKR